mmetsp:Transcript_29922/g.55940  ORF Transcript_29922/g.55940 Transcript_29922/m.55940 type:complete len:225 (-) Transcript_29922:253-927(-)
MAKSPLATVAAVAAAGVGAGILLGAAMFQSSEGGSKKTTSSQVEAAYKKVKEKVEEYVAASQDPLTVLANTSALIYTQLKDLRGSPATNWCGFYLVRPTEAKEALILGPFNGKPAVVRIEFGKGVCGTAALSGETQVVDDVHKCPNHIACDSASQSEIVVPIKVGGDVVGVLDIDCPVIKGFNDIDKKYLEEICDILASGLLWNSVCGVKYEQKDPKKSCGNGG